ncbi:MAG: DNA-binding transcriptional LysR family regulator [bacterium]
MAPLPHDFILQYPDIQLHLELTNQKIDLIEQRFDLAIRLGKLEDSGLMSKQLSTRTRYVCASHDYLTSSGTPHVLSELAHHNCLRGNLDYWRFQEKGKKHIVRINGSIHCNSGHALTDAVLKGIGIVQLPDYYVQRHIKRGDLVTILDNYREPSEGIWPLYPQNRHLSPKIRLLVEFLSKKIKP